MILIRRPGIAGCWAIIPGDHQADLVPFADAVAHEAGSDCVCGPATQLVTCPCGADTWAYEHHRLDRQS